MTHSPNFCCHGTEKLFQNDKLSKSFLEKSKSKKLITEAQYAYWMVKLGRKVEIPYYLQVKFLKNKA